MLTKITHSTLFVNDQNAALDFYTKLGFLCIPMLFLAACVGLP